MALDRRAREQQVDLVVVVAVAAEVLDDAQAGLAVGDGGVHVVLDAVLVDGEALCGGEGGFVSRGSGSLGRGVGRV